MLTATDNLTELDISELVDMECEPACEHSAHGHGDPKHVGPAWALIRIDHPCHAGEHILICKSGYEKTRTIMCLECGGRGIPRNEVWKLVSVL